LGGVAEGLSPIGLLQGWLNALEGLDISSRDYYRGLLTGVLLAGGVAVTSNVLRHLTPTSATVKAAEKALAKGATEVHVNSVEEAAELYLRNFHGYGYRNTTGMTGNQVRNDPFLFPNKKGGTYHWDLADMQHGGVPHLQIHTHDGRIIRIFFKVGN